MPMAWSCTLDFDVEDCELLVVCQFGFKPSHPISLLKTISRSATPAPLAAGFVQA